MAAKTLFTVPIPPLKDHVGGEIVCTEPAPEVYLLTFSSPPDNRLTPAFCASMIKALDLIELHKPTPTGVVITTSAITKFYSNGLDLDLAIRTPGFTEEALYPLFHRFLTYPMPTIALVNGHAFAGGFMLAMHHDYRVVRRPPAAAHERHLPDQAAGRGVPDHGPGGAAVGRAGGAGGGDPGRADGMEGALALVRDGKLTAKGKTGVYGLLKEEMYREQVALLSATGKDVVKFSDAMGRETKRKAELKKRGGESKL
ncbi:hypothetical protein G7054_g4181 [Neopestalotiopsis clavispora]|nr:hypothetical protein G7054_g4181 [Neopestalotiopsis clavispora]